MLPDRVSNPGPLTYESGALPIALCGPAKFLGFLYLGGYCFLSDVYCPFSVELLFSVF